MASIEIFIIYFLLLISLILISWSSAEIYTINKLGDKYQPTINKDSFIIMLSISVLFFIGSLASLAYIDHVKYQRNNRRSSNASSLSSVSTISL